MTIIKKIIIKLRHSETKRYIRKIFLKIFDIFGLNDFFRLINGRKMIILIYHGISEKSFNFNHRRYLPKSTLLKQIVYLKKKKYQFITLTDWVKIINEKKRIGQRYIVLTFDDGFKNVIDNAYPIMKKLNAKGCIYIVPDIIDHEKLLWSDYIELLIRNSKNLKFKFLFKEEVIEYDLISSRNIKEAYGNIKAKLRTLNKERLASHLSQFNISNDIKNFQNVPKDYLIANWVDLYRLDKKYLEVGSHTKTHIKLSMLNTEEELFEELYNSKLKIEKKIGYAIDHLCYPYGDYNNLVISNAKKYKYLTGVTIDMGFNSLKTDLLRLKRINVPNDFLLFKSMVSGLYTYIKKKIINYF